MVRKNAFHGYLVSSTAQLDAHTSKILEVSSLLTDVANQRAGTVMDARKKLTDVQGDTPTCVRRIRNTVRRIMPNWNRVMKGIIIMCKLSDNASKFTGTETFYGDRLPPEVLALRAGNSSVAPTGL